MKYIIEIENEPFGRNDDPVIPHGMDELYRAKGFKSLVFDKNGLDKLIPYTEPDRDRKAIENEVWEFVRGLLNYIDDDWEIITNTLLLDIPYQEAKAKYEAWKKQKVEIHVGDEVETESGNKACVLYENPDGTQMFVFKVDGTATWWSKCAIHKTGKNHPEVAELLEKMRGDKGC